MWKDSSRRLHDGSRTQAIREFAPLKEITHVRQFIGSTNWIRFYLSNVYSTLVKILGEWMKPGAEFPEEGLGCNNKECGNEGCKTVKAIKILCEHSIETAVLDEPAAIDGTRPLEMVADASGYAWGSTNVQMTEDLTRFKVLLMVGKGFTPAQQAWPALTLEAHAQLQGKRYQRKILGAMKSINWTDHQNVVRLQTADLNEVDVKHIRWISEIVQDLSLIHI